jgi:hypothetical protein
LNSRAFKPPEMDLGRRAGPRKKPSPVHACALGFMKAASLTGCRPEQQHFLRPRGHHCRLNPVGIVDAAIASRISCGTFTAQEVPRKGDGFHRQWASLRLEHRRATGGGLPGAPGCARFAEHVGKKVLLV